MLRLAQRPLEARRRNGHGVGAQVVAENVRDLLAERVVDAAVAVDVDRETLGTSQLDREHVDARQGLRDLAADLALQGSLPLVDVCQFAALTKNGRLAPISPI